LGFYDFRGSRRPGLGALMHIFVYSYIIRCRKPDEGIFRVALEMARQDKLRRLRQGCLGHNTLWAKIRLMF
jgi:hypothetical protein